MCTLILIYIPIMSFVPCCYPDPLYQTLEDKITKTKNLEIGFVSFADSFASIFCFNRILTTLNI